MLIPWFWGRTSKNCVAVSTKGQWRVIQGHLHTGIFVKVPPRPWRLALPVKMCSGPHCLRSGSEEVISVTSWGNSLVLLRWLLLLWGKGLPIRDNCSHLDIAGPAGSWYLGIVWAPVYKDVNQSWNLGDSRGKIKEAIEPEGQDGGYSGSNPQNQFPELFIYKLNKTGTNSYF